jgi:hypothetical protein
MEIDHLLRQRSALLRRTRLANLAYAYAELGVFAGRIARGNLRGAVTLHPADPAAGRAWPSLVAEQGSQSVLDEHFLEEELLDLADLLAFATGTDLRSPLKFRLEDFDQRFRTGLRRDLEKAGIEVPAASARHARRKRP